MADKGEVWYRQLAAPGVEYKWDVVSAYPKKFRLTIRSVTNPAMDVSVEVDNIANTPLTNYLVQAHNQFARIIEEKIREERKRRIDQIVAREAEEQRAIQERKERESAGAPEGQPGGDDQAAKPDVGEQLEGRADGAAKRPAKSKGRKRQARRDGAANGDQAVPVQRS